MDGGFKCMINTLSNKPKSNSSYPVSKFHTTKTIMMKMEMTTESSAKTTPTIQSFVTPPTIHGEILVNFELYMDAVPKQPASLLVFESGVFCSVPCTIVGSC